MTGQLPRGAVEVRPRGPLRGALVAPASKSVTNRLLVVAALADGDSHLRAPLDSDDSSAMRALVTGLGARVDDVDDGWVVHGLGGRLATPPHPLDARLSGTTMRFGAAIAALAPGPVTVTGQPPLRRRPVGALSAALRALGADVYDRDGYPPVVAGGGIAGGEVTVDASASSQYASALLLAAPYAHGPVTVHVGGETALAYVDLTAEVCSAWGGRVQRVGRRTWRVRPGGYQARAVDVEYDASAAAHLFAFAVATGGQVTVTNTGPTRQPDAGVVAVFEAMGARSERTGSALTVRGPLRPRAVDVDLGAMPDTVPIVAVLAALADGTSRIRGAAVVRGHETDRLAALAAELGRAGVQVVEHADGLSIAGGARGPARLATHDDHRLAMAFAALAARVPGITIEEPWCVAKTYPAFWSDIGRIGVSWHEQRT